MDSSKDQLLVSIGIPFYNSQAFLKDAIVSVLNQSYSNWELILVDDGSNDDSIKIAEEFESKDKRIRLISDGQNLGLPTRLNQLSRLSRGYYYARMDADDIMHTDRLKNQIKYLIDNQDVDLLGSGLISIDNNNNILGIRRGGYSDNISLKDALKSGWAVHPTITGKTVWFKKYQYNEQLRRAQDYELWIRTVEESKFVKLKEPYLFYREASTSSMRKYFNSTKYSLNTFWNNRNIVGWNVAFLLSIDKVIKLLIYSLYFLFGMTDKLIMRRYAILPNKTKLKFEKMLEESIK